MLKMRYFLGKNCKNRLSVGGSAPESPFASGGSDPRVVTPAYYYNFVEFISSGECILSRLKKKQVTTANVLLCVFRTFSPIIFNSNSVSFVAREHKNISCPRAHPSYATVQKEVKLRNIIIPTKNNTPSNLIKPNSKINR